MKTLLLKHPTLGLCAQSVLSRANYENKIKEKWRQRYGQKFKECVIEIYDDNPKLDQITNLKTGEIYKNKCEAKALTGLSVCHINKILGKQLTRNSDYFLIWSQNKAF